MGSFSSFALAIVSAAILSSYFDKTEYGTYRQILYVYNTLLVIFTAGLPKVFAYYLPRYNLAQGKDIVWKISRILFLLGLVFSAFLFTCSGLIADLLRNPELSKGLKYFSPIPMLLLPTLGIEGIFSTYKKTIFIAIYNTLSRLLMLLFIVLPVIIFRGSYLYAIYGWLAVSVITLMIAYFFKSIPFAGVITEKSSLKIKEIFLYSVPLAFASAAGIAIKSADQFYISRYFGTDVFAEFSNGFVELPFAHMITGAVSTVLMPVFSKMIHDKTDTNILGDLWKSSLLKSATLIYPMVVFFMFFPREVMTILYSSKYVESSGYFVIAMTINFFNVIVFAPLIFSLGETRFYARLHIWIAVAAWVLSYFLVIIFKSAIAIAVFSAFRSISIIIIALIFTSKRLNTKFIELFPALRLLRIGLHSLTIAIVVKLIADHFLYSFSSWLIFVFSALSFALLLILSSRIFGIDYLHIVRTFLKNETK